MADYSNSEQWYFAASITQCARGVYSISVDVGDEMEPNQIHWAAATPAKARRYARSKAAGPLHWEEQRLNPGELAFGYCLRKHYLAQVSKEDLESAAAELEAAGGPLEMVMT